MQLALPSTTPTHLSEPETRHQDEVQTPARGEGVLPPLGCGRLLDAPLGVRETGDVLHRVDLQHVHG